MYSSRGTPLFPKSNISQPMPTAPAAWRSRIRAGFNACILCGSCEISFGAGSPRPRAMAAAAEVRSCAWHELHPPMRMKLWLCFSKSSKAGARAAEIVR